MEDNSSPQVMLEDIVSDSQFESFNYKVYMDFSNLNGAKVDISVKIENTSTNPAVLGEALNNFVKKID